MSGPVRAHTRIIAAGETSAGAGAGNHLLPNFKIINYKGEAGHFFQRNDFQIVFRIVCLMSIASFHGSEDKPLRWKLIKKILQQGNLGQN